ncbi:unnamed protein product [Ixodes pacificus]
MHVRQPKRHKIRQKLSYADFAKSRKFYKCDKQSKERPKDGNKERKKWQQVFVHAKRSTNDIADRMLDRRAIWENREQERKIRDHQGALVFFDWNASENTALDCNPLYKDRHSAQFYGGGTSRSSTSRPKRRGSPSSTASRLRAGGRRPRRTKKFFG